MQGPVNLLTRYQSGLDENFTNPDLGLTMNLAVFHVNGLFWERLREAFLVSENFNPMGITTAPNDPRSFCLTHGPLGQVSKFYLIIYQNSI